jgi:predicted RNA-binding protein YlqC (UPF0109 family)
VRELLETMAKALVGNPDRVQVRAVEGEEVTILELRVDPNDVGKVIGRNGRNVITTQPAIELEVLLNALRLPYVCALRRLTVLIWTGSAFPHVRPGAKVTENGADL